MYLCYSANLLCTSLTFSSVWESLGCCKLLLFAITLKLNWCYSDRACLDRYLPTQRGVSNLCAVMSHANWVKSGLEQGRVRAWCSPQTEEAWKNIRDWKLLIIWIWWLTCTFSLARPNNSKQLQYVDNRLQSLSVGPLQKRVWAGSLSAPLFTAPHTCCVWSEANERWIKWKTTGYVSVTSVKPSKQGLYQNIMTVRASCCRWIA